MSRRKLAYLVFPDAHLEYAPSVLNSIALLSRYGFKVVVFHASKSASSQSEDTESVVFISAPPFHLPQHLPLRGKISHFIGFLSLFSAFLGQLLFERPDIVLGFDSRGFLVSRILAKNSIYFSLEAKIDVYHRAIQFLGVKRLAIQSLIRRDYLFPSSTKPLTHIVPNSSILWTEPELRRYRLPSSADYINIIYCGTLIWSHFPLECMQVIRLDKRYRLTIKGNAGDGMLQLLHDQFPDLFATGRILIDETYLSQTDLIDFLAGFDIGFCLYPSSILADFNYYTCPSGKMYVYFHAQVPCIGSLIPGLDDVERFRAGVLIENLSADAIHLAIQKILSNYSLYKRGCLNASRETNFKPFFDSMLNSPL
jgi:hypothetical protein